jgi:uncharacterized protein YuzE
MKTIYDAESDALYVRFADSPVVKSEEVADGVVLDFDGDGKVAGFEFLEARKHIAAGARFPAVAE